MFGRAHVSRLNALFSDSSEYPLLNRVDIVGRNIERPGVGTNSRQRISMTRNSDYNQAPLIGVTCSFESKQIQELNNRRPTSRNSLSNNIERKKLNSCLEERRQLTCLHRQTLLNYFPHLAFLPSDETPILHINNSNYVSSNSTPTLPMTRYCLPISGMLI